jgi:hypothetical protein
LTSNPTFMKGSNMQFGISTHILKEYPVSEALAMISRTGRIGTTELGSDHGERLTIKDVC